MSDKEIITKTLLVKLTEKELLEFSDKLASLNQDLTQTDLEKKEISADYSAKEKSLQSNIASTSRIIVNKEEYRKIDCQWVFNNKKNIKNLKRLDTNEIIDTKDITDEDRQGKLNIV